MTRVVMELMRHSDLKLTMKTYTDTAQLPVADAVKHLPGYCENNRLPQLLPQNLVTMGHSPSSAVTGNEKSELHEAYINKGESHGLTEGVTRVTRVANGGERGIRTPV